MEVVCNWFLVINGQTTTNYLRGVRGGCLMITLKWVRSCVFECSFSKLIRRFTFSVIQYGFVTLFVVAFPLAPLFALLNNVFEMRLDAKKFLKYYRRPVPTRVKDIGVWFNIMAILGRIAVVSSVNTSVFFIVLRFHTRSPFFYLQFLGIHHCIFIQFYTAYGVHDASER